MFDWVPRSATAVGLLAGPLIVVGYLAGSVPFVYLSARRRLRRQLDQPAVDHLVDAESPPAGDRAATHLDSWALPALATLAATTLAWHLTLAATPGANLFSSVGIFSNQAIGAWVSVALWTGMAAVVGHAAPVWTSFRGGTGLPPAAALTIAYIPVIVAVGLGAGLVAYGVTRQPRTALAWGLPAMVTYAYLAWLGDLQAGWGVTNGPETTLWTAVLAATVFAGNLRAGWHRQSE